MHLAPRASLWLALTAALALVHSAALAVTPGYETRLPTPVESALMRPDSVELLSLQPGAGGDTFEGTGVRGRTVLKDPAARAKVIKALFKGIEEGPSEPNRCFDPHHGLRVTAGKWTYDLVICFHCQWIKVFGAEKTAYVLVDRSAADAFNTVLRAAGLPVPAE